MAKKKKHDVLMKVRITREEQRLYNKACDTAGYISLSEWIRHQLKAAANATIG